jgi:putative glutamine amidotransferase
MRPNRPVIGIVPSFDDGINIPAGGDVKRIYIRHEYMQAVENAGAVPVILHPNMSFDVITKLCDGIVISGGGDIDPTTYGQEPIPEAMFSQVERNHEVLSVIRFEEPSRRFEWEKQLIEACDGARIPILGICYGMQRLNVHYGGTLFQDIPIQHPNNIGHDVTEHEIRFVMPFFGMDGTHTIASRHHQAVDQLAEGFSAVATAPDGILEAISGHGHFGMQWHPESDATGLAIYSEFVRHCASRKSDI